MQLLPSAAGTEWATHYARSQIKFSKGPLANFRCNVIGNGDLVCIQLLPNLAYTQILSPEAQAEPWAQLAIL